MDISKVHHTENPIVKIGIIGPKPFGLGGYDNNTYRLKIKDSINNIFKDLMKEFTLVGITGLGLGIEQDFVQLCINNSIEYTVYLPYNEQEKYWSHLSPDLIKSYSYYLDNALNIIQLDNGKYSPKKIISKRKKILNESDYVIYVKHKEIEQINLFNQKLLENYQDKTIFII